MDFSNWLVESAERQIAEKVAKEIYSKTENTACDVTNIKVCHAAVLEIKNKGKDLYIVFESGVKYKFYRELTFIIWDESKWDKMSKFILDDDSHKRIKNRYFQELIDDIADGSVNGHSLIRFKKNYYIDPYFDSLGASFADIQKIGKWFELAYSNL